MWKSCLNGKWCILNHNGKVLRKFNNEHDCDVALERALFRKWHAEVKSRNPANDTTNIEQFVTDKKFSEQRLAG